MVDKTKGMVRLPDPGSDWDSSDEEWVRSMDRRLDAIMRKRIEGKHGQEFLDALCTAADGLPDLRQLRAMIKGGRPQ